MPDVNSPEFVRAREKWRAWKTSDLIIMLAEVGRWDTRIETHALRAEIDERIPRPEISPRLTYEGPRE